VEELNIMKKVVIIQVAPKFAEIIPIYCKECLKHDIFDNIYIASPVDLPQLDDRCRVIRLKRDFQFSSNILRTLPHISEEVILLCCDDHIMVQEHNKQEFDDTFNFVLSNKNVVSLRLSHNSKVKFQNKSGLIGEILPSYNYLFSLQPTWVRKDYLTAMLRHGEDAWDAEHNGTARAKGVPLAKKYAVTKQVYFATNFYRKGQYLRAEFVEYALENNINIVNVLPVYTKRTIGGKRCTGLVSMEEYIRNKEGGTLDQMVLDNRVEKGVKRLPR
jgi:hypothetical protein